MPSPFTSSFASAAAGNVSNDSFSSRVRGEGSGDWYETLIAESQILHQSHPRSSGETNAKLTSRSRTHANGATTTFRRPSLATNLSQQRETSQSNTSNINHNSGVYVPPHMNANHSSRGGALESRYSKEQLLDLFRVQMRGSSSVSHIADLYEDGWDPLAANGIPDGGWSRRDESKDALSGPEICWDHGGKVQPLGLIDMTEEEQTVRNVVSFKSQCIC